VAWSAARRATQDWVCSADGASETARMSSTLVRHDRDQRHRSCFGVGARACGSDRTLRRFSDGRPAV
jgi:hypothetical protein